MSKDVIPNSGSDKQVKDPAIFITWITAILIISGVFWFLTQPLRTRTLVKAVNRVLEQSDDYRSLQEQRADPRSGLFGMNTRFIIETAEAGEMKAVIFPFMGEGTFFPCLAVIDAEGKVLEFIPLSNHGKRIINRISPRILKIYARRIEGNSL